MKQLFSGNIFLVSLFIFFTLNNSFAQGYVMIVGGGTENYNDWSNIPYTWAVDNSENKKVAIVSFNSETSWLPSYFISLGAATAKNFRINTSALANSQDTYDSLMAYDVIFFKGGNQANYYLTYKNSKVQDAVSDKFNNGGVIAGTSAGLHILSGVVFTSENGTAYSDEVLKNIFHNSITLKNDFLDIMPGYIFDSHFVERGRLGRMLAFMARWKHDHDEGLVGIGVDDMTAFCIDLTDPDNVMGYAYGTAAVNIYRDGDFGHQNNKLHCQDVKATQLLHGCSINLNTFEADGFGSQMAVEQTAEYGNRTLLLSGSDPVNENQLFITHLVDSVGARSEPILIITGASTTLANAYRQAFQNAGATTVDVEQAIPANNNSSVFQSLIEQASKIVFIGNSYQTLYDFMYSGSGNGDLLQEKIHAVGTVVGFIGDNSRMAGTEVVSDNYITNPNASFYGQLSFNPGLNLLSTMVIIPNTYLYNTDYYENTNSALPYALLEKQIYRGVWLTVRNFMKYYVEFPYAYITVHGESPAMILTSQEGGYDLNAQIFRNRQVGGFEYMDFRTLLYPNTMQVGDVVYGIESPATNNGLKAYYDATSRTITVRFESTVAGNIEFGLYDINGQLIHTVNRNLPAGENNISFKTPALTNGLYLLQVQTRDVVSMGKVMVLR
jgi:cyanophycinase-like exopeptidase